MTGVQPSREGQEKIGLAGNKGFLERATTVIQPRGDKVPVDVGTSLPYALLQAPN